MLKGKVILVTGGAQRVGREIVLALAADGAEVVIHYNRSGEAATALAAEIHERFKINALLVKADLTQAEDVKAIVPQILEKKKHLFAIVNNASIYQDKLFELITEEEWDTNLAVHVKAPFLLAQAAYHSMKKRGEGKIVNIADWAGSMPYKDYLSYCVSKGALIDLTRALAKEMASEVQVNCICPGPVLRPVHFSPEKFAEDTKGVLSQKIGSPHDVVHAVRYFLHASSFVTGSVLTVDGGRSLGTV